MMKKCLIIVLFILLGLSLASCNESNPTPQVPDNKDILYGTDGAKYLLAQNRLNESILDESVGIFEGEEVLTKLANKVKLSRNNLNKNTIQNSLDTVYVGDDYIEWDAQQKDYSNSMSYFLNLTGNVEQSAMQGAELIKYVKSNIRVIDVWVKTPNGSYLLVVDENSETIYEKLEDQYYICRRYTNDEGQNVYELYYNNEVGQSRMKYIENTLIEYFHSNHTVDFQHHFMADNTKGYWDVFGWLNNEDYSATIIKDDIVYDYIGQVGESSSFALDIVSNDRKNDVITISGPNSITLYTTAFNGIDKFRMDIDSPNDIVDTESMLSGKGKVWLSAGTYTVIDYQSVDVVLDDGTIFESGNFLTDNVKYESSMLSYDFGEEVYFNQMNLFVEGNTIEEGLANLKVFLDQYNITCKYDLDKILDNILIAQEEISSNSLYKKWNDVIINSEDNLMLAYTKETEKFNEFEDLLKKVKDVEEIDIDNQEVYYANIAFAKIVSSNKNNISFDGEKIIIGNLSLTIDDTRLLDELETYTISFGLLKKGNTSNVVILNFTADQFKYEVSKTYTISYTGEIELLDLDFGEYIPVFYLSTSDGIRLSEIEPIIFDEVIEVNYKDENHIVSIKKSEENYLYMSIERNLEIYVSQYYDKAVTYDELMLYFGSTANVYGIISPDSVIEIYNEETQEYVVFDTASEILTGKYRVKYKVYIDGEYYESYVFLDLVVEVVETPSQG